QGVSSGLRGRVAVVIGEAPHANAPKRKGRAVPMALHGTTPLRVPAVAGRGNTGGGTPPTSLRRAADVSCGLGARGAHRRGARRPLDGKVDADGVAERGHLDEELARLR